jgi:hypothetical protein
MSQWGQDATRVAALRRSSATDFDRWSRLESHNKGWINRAKLAVQFIAKDASVLELGAGHAFLRGLLDPSCSYQPSDIVMHQPDFLVIDLNKQFNLPRQYDVIVGLGVFEYVYNISAAFMVLRESMSRLIFTYCCRIPGSDVDIRMRQGWLSDLNENSVDQLLLDLDLNLHRKFAIQELPAFRQIMYVVDVS